MSANIPYDKCGEAPPARTSGGTPAPECWTRIGVRELAVRPASGPRTATLCSAHLAGCSGDDDPHEVFELTSGLTPVEISDLADRARTLSAQFDLKTLRASALKVDVPRQEVTSDLKKHTAAARSLLATASGVYLNHVSICPGRLPGGQTRKLVEPIEVQDADALRRVLAGAGDQIGGVFWVLDTLPAFPSLGVEDFGRPVTEVQELEELSEAISIVASWNSLDAPSRRDFRRVALDDLISRSVIAIVDCPGARVRVGSKPEFVKLDLGMSVITARPPTPLERVAREKEGK